LRDITIEEDEVFEKPALPSRAQSLKEDVRSYQPERAESFKFNQDVLPRRSDQSRDERYRKSYEDLRRAEDRQRKSFEDLRHVDERQQKSFEDLRRTKRSYEDLSYLSPRTRNRTYSAGFESMKSSGDSSPFKASGDSRYSFGNSANGTRLKSPVDSQYSFGHTPNGNPLKSTSGDSRLSLGNNSNGNGTLKSSSCDSRYSFGNNGNGGSSKSSSGDSRHLPRNNSPNGNGTNRTNPFHPYQSEEWQTQTGRPSSLDVDVSDTQTEAYSSYASTLEKDINPDRKSVNNNNVEYDDYHYGAWETSGSLEKTYQKQKIRDKPVNFVKPSIPVKPQIPIKPQMITNGPASPSILKGGYRVDNMPTTPTKGDGAEFVFDCDPIKAAVQLQKAMDCEPLKIYTQYQISEAARPRDGVIFDPAKLQTPHSETASETGQSGTLKSNTTNASNATNRSLDHYRQDYRSVDMVIRSGHPVGETQSVASSSDDSALKVIADDALERVERIAERNRTNRLQRSRIKRLGCGVCQIIAGLSLIATAVLIFLNTSQGWFTCAGFWAGTFAAVGGSLGILTHFNSKAMFVKIMIGLTMFNICVVYLGTFCIGLSFGLVQIEKGGVHAFLDALNFIYIGLCLLGIVASVIQMSPVEKYSELRELEIAKCFVDWKALQTKPSGIDRTSSTNSSSRGSREQDGYRNYGYESSNYGDAVTTV
jgi:hypothetical protein